MTILASLAVFFSMAAVTVTSVPAPGLAVSDITANHGSVQQTAAVGDDALAFFSVHNDGSTPDALTGWSCTVAKATLLVGADGKPIENLLLPPNKGVTMSAKGLHMVLQGNRFTIDRGSIIPCALTFQNEGDVQILLYAIDAKK